MRYLTLSQITELHRQVIEHSGGSHGIRDTASLETAVAQPEMTFGGADLYPALAEKAAALAHSLIQNHSFVDGNKRVGHSAMEVFLVLNGYEIAALVEEQEQVFLAVAEGRVSRGELGEWIRQHLIERSSV